MELVVDANILVAAFLRSAVTRELLLNERLTLSTPEHGLTEVEHVLSFPRIRRRLGGLSSAEMQSLFMQLTSNIRAFPRSVYQPQFSKASRLAPHIEDAPYLALALQFHLPLWSNDLALKEQRAVPVYTTRELLKLLA